MVCKYEMALTLAAIMFLCTVHFGTALPQFAKMMSTGEYDMKNVASYPTNLNAPRAMSVDNIKRVEIQSKVSTAQRRLFEKEINSHTHLHILNNVQLKDSSAEVHLKSKALQYPKAMDEKSNPHVKLDDQGRKDAVISSIREKYDPRAQPNKNSRRLLASQNQLATEETSEETSEKTSEETSVKTSTEESIETSSGPATSETVETSAETTVTESGTTESETTEETSSAPLSTEETTKETTELSTIETVESTRETTEETTTEAGTTEETATSGLAPTTEESSKESTEETTELSTAETGRTSEETTESALTTGETTEPGTTEV